MSLNIRELSEKELLETAEFIIAHLQYTDVDFSSAFELPVETVEYVNTLDKLGKCQLLHQITQDLHDRAYASADTLILNSKAA